MKVTAQEIELAVAKRLDNRKNIFTARIQKGLDFHEMDLVMLRPTGYATEFEIKITKSDLMKDKKKEHGHKSDRIKEFFYAIPRELISVVISKFPKECGIIGVTRMPDFSLSAEVIREATPNPNARKWTEEERLKLLRLAYMRVWKLLEENIKLKQR